MQTIEEYKAYTKQLEDEVGKWHHAYDALMVERNLMAATLAENKKIIETIAAELDELRKHEVEWDLSKARIKELETENKRLKENLTMTQKKKSSIDFDCLAVTDVKVTVFPNLPGAAHVKGVAEVVLNDQFIVRGLRILDGTTGLFVSYPVDPFYKGEDLRSIAQPITRQLREHIENCILEKYQEISSQEA